MAKVTELPAALQPPEHWAAILEESEAEAARGEGVPVDEILAELDEIIARMELKAAEAR